MELQERIIILTKHLESIPKEQEDLIKAIKYTIELLKNYEEAMDWKYSKGIEDGIQTVSEKYKNEYNEEIVKIVKYFIYKKS